MGKVIDRLKKIPTLKKEHDRIYQEYKRLMKEVAPLRERYLWLMQNYENLDEDQRKELEEINSKYKKLIEPILELEEKMIEKSQSMNKKYRTYKRAS